VMVITWYAVTPLRVGLGFGHHLVRR
jgi:hypothetical protein